MSLPHTCVDCGAIHHEEYCPHCCQLAPGQTWEHIPILTVGCGREFGKMVMFTAEELAILEGSLDRTLKPFYSTPSKVLVVQRVPKIGDVYPFSRKFRIEAVQQGPATHEGIRGTMHLSDGEGSFIARFWVPQNQTIGYTADIQFDEEG